MIINHYVVYSFLCHVIGPVSSIRIWIDNETGYGVGLRDGQECDIYDVPGFLMLASNRGCEIKPY